MKNRLNMVGLIFLLTSCTDPAPATAAKAVKANADIVFRAEQVPQFYVVEGKGKNRVIIDSSHLKTKVEIKSK